MNPENKRQIEEWRNSGWYPAIKTAGYSLDRLCPKIKFTQIKSKFGGLRFYYTIPIDLDLSDLPPYAATRERLEQQAEEIIRYAEGWVDGYERANSEARR